MRFRIINPLRFQRAVITILAIMCLLCFVCFKVNCEKQEAYEVHKVTVCEGDTMWTIADSYNGENVDVRYVVHTMRHINGLHSSEIYPGEVIYVPIYVK